MKFWNYNLIIFLLVIVSSISAQETKLILVKSIPINADFIEVDNIGNLYVFKGGEIVKLTIEGKILSKNSTLSFGKLTSIDASNALKTVLFFKDQSQVIYLDNQLSIRGERIQLDFLGFLQTTMVCKSYNDALWIYDQTTFELIRLNEQLQPVTRSGNLSQILDYSPNPNYMREVNNWLYVNDPEQGIMLFDWYGSYTKTIPIKGLNKFIIRAGKLFYIESGMLKSYDIKTGLPAQVQLSELEILDFSIFGDKLLLITINELFIYRIVMN